MSRLVEKWYVAIAAGAAYVWCLYVGFGRDSDVPPLTLAIAASAVTLLLSLGLRALGHNSILKTSLFFFVGLVGAILVEVALDLIQHRPERNLFPLEIMLLIIVGAPGFIIGSIVGYGVHRMRHG
jgi:hypothetical protein